MCKGNFVLATLQMCLSQKSLQPNSSFDSLLSGLETVYWKKKHLLRQKSKWWFHMIMSKMQKTKKKTHPRLQTEKTQRKKPISWRKWPNVFHSLGHLPAFPPPPPRNANIHHEEVYTFHSERKLIHQMMAANCCKSLRQKKTWPSPQLVQVVNRRVKFSQIVRRLLPVQMMEWIKQIAESRKSRNETSWWLNQPIWKSNRIISPRDRGEK